MANEATSPRKDPEVSGKLVILILFVFGVVMTGTMWIYWKMHLAPFLPLQRAIAETEEYKESRPVVEGGREKGKPELPNILRVTMKVDYAPKEETEKVDVIVQDVLKLAKENLPQVKEYEVLELNLYWPKQESELTPLTEQRRAPLHEE